VQNIDFVFKDSSSTLFEGIFVNKLGFLPYLSVVSCYRCYQIALENNLYFEILVERKHNWFDNTYIT